LMGGLSHLVQRGGD